MRQHQPEPGEARDRAGDVAQDDQFGPMRVSMPERGVEGDASRGHRMPHRSPNVEMPAGRAFASSSRLSWRVSARADGSLGVDRRCPSRDMLKNVMSSSGALTAYRATAVCPASFGNATTRSRSESSSVNRSTLALTASERTRRSISTQGLVLRDLPQHPREQPS